MNIIINPLKFFRSLLAAIFIITVLYLACQFCKFYLGHGTMFGLVRLFDFAEEANIPSLFSALLLLFSSFLLAMIAAYKRRDHDTFFPHWAGLSFIFFFLFVDEAVSLHELLVRPVKEILHTSGLFFYAWIIPYAFLLLMIAIVYVRFFFHLSYRMKLFFVLSGLIFVAGAIGFEMLGGKHDEASGQENVLYVVYVLFEELFEMIGSSLFVYALLCYLKEKYGQAQIDITFGDN